MDETMSQEQTFLDLAKRYYRHHCKDDDCLVCEAINWIENGQSDVAHQFWGQQFYVGQDFALIKREPNEV